MYCVTTGKADRVHQARSEVDQEIARYKAQADMECKMQEEEVGYLLSFPYGL